MNQFLQRGNDPATMSQSEKARQHVFQQPKKEQQRKTGDGVSAIAVFLVCVQAVLLIFVSMHKVTGMDDSFYRVSGTSFLLLRLMAVLLLLLLPFLMTFQQWAHRTVLVIEVLLTVVVLLGANGGFPATKSQWAVILCGMVALLLLLIKQKVFDAVPYYRFSMGTIVGTCLFLLTQWGNAALTLHLLYEQMGHRVTYAKCLLRVIGMMGPGGRYVSEHGINAVPMLEGQITGYMIVFLWGVLLAALLTCGYLYFVCPSGESEFFELVGFVAVTVVSLFTGWSKKRKEEEALTAAGEEAEAETETESTEDEQPEAEAETESTEDEQLEAEAQEESVESESAEVEIENDEPEEIEESTENESVEEEDEATESEPEEEGAEVSELQEDVVEEDTEQEETTEESEPEETTESEPESVEETETTEDEQPETEVEEEAVESESAEAEIENDKPEEIEESTENESVEEEDEVTESEPAEEEAEVSESQEDIEEDTEPEEQIEEVELEATAESKPEETTEAEPEVSESQETVVEVAEPEETTESEPESAEETESTETEQPEPETQEQTVESEPEPEAEIRQGLAACVADYAKNFASYMALDPGGHIFEGTAREGYIPYRIIGKEAVISGGPICKDSNAASLFAEFEDFCYQKKISMTFVNVSKEQAELLMPYGVERIHCGAEPRFTLENYKLRTDAQKSRQREQIRKKYGVVIQEYRYYEHRDPELEYQMSALNDDWLDSRNGENFTIYKRRQRDAFLPQALSFENEKQRRYYYACNEKEELVGLIGFCPVRSQNGYSCEIGRKREGQIKNLMELIMHEAFASLKEEEAKWASMGLMPESDIEGSVRQKRWLSFIYRYYESIYACRDIKQAYPKYKPTSWEEMYIVTREYQEIKKEKQETK